MEKMTFSASEQHATTPVFWTTAEPEAFTNDTVDLLPLPETKMHMAIVKAFNLYIEGFIMFSGLIGNFLILAVFIKRNIKGSSCIFIRALSITDFLILSICLNTHWINYNFNKTGKAIPLCKTILFLTNGFFDFEAWVMVSMTVDRFISVTRPLFVRAWCTKERALIILLINFVVTCFKNGYMVVLGGFQYSQHLGTMVCTLMYDKSKLVDRVYPWLDLIWGSLLPLILIIIFNTGIIHGLHKMPIIQRVTNASARSRRDRQITISLLLISFVFLLLTLPRKLFLLYFTYAEVPLGAARILHSANYQLAHTITSKMWFLNCSINIWLFTLSASNFRKDFASILLCRRRNRIVPLGHEMRDTGKENLDDGTRASTSRKGKPTTHPRRSKETTIIDQ